MKHWVTWRDFHLKKLAGIRVHNDSESQGIWYFMYVYSADKFYGTYQMFFDIFFLKYLLRPTNPLLPHSLRQIPHFDNSGSHTIFDSSWGRGFTEEKKMTYLVLEIFSNGTHIVTIGRSDVTSLPLSIILGFCIPDSSTALLFNTGGDSSPSKTTHCARYVFLICEKTWVTSPIGVIDRMRNVSKETFVFLLS